MVGLVDQRLTTFAAEAVAVGVDPESPRIIVPRDPRRPTDRWPCARRRRSDAVCTGALQDAAQISVGERVTVEVANASSSGRRRSCATAAS